MKIAFIFPFVVTLCISTSIYANVVGQAIVTDGTMGAIPTYTPQALAPSATNAKSFEIPQNLGTTVGNNLFHSFNSFGINTGETVTFQGDAALKNVISRVTGGQVSVIDGVLRSTIPKANFYFINPAGITFGANAKIDVPAAFHVSTANTLRFRDNTEFSSSTADVSKLTVDPVSFGFLTSSPGNFGTITIVGSKLSVAKGTALDLVANGISIKKATLSAPAGEMRLIALQGTGDVSTLTHNIDNLPLPSATSGGIIMVDENNAIKTDDGGHLTLWGGDIELKNNSIISALTTGEIAGSIKVYSDTLNMNNGSAMSTSTQSTGNAGEVNVTANALTIDATGTIIFTGIQSQTKTNSTGNSGTINIKAGSLNIQNAAKIRTDTSTTGDAGIINITANTLMIDGKNNASFTGITSIAKSASSGNAGTILVNAGELKIFNHGQISSSSESTVSLAKVNPKLSNAGTIKVTSPFIYLNNNSLITTSATTGNGGNITINADKLINLQDSEFITSVFGANGRGGDINISAHGLILNNAAIQANAVGGIGGDINLNLQALIPSQSQLLIGGEKVNWLPYQQGLNVIQAASQSGVSGTVNVTSPKFNISGSLVGLNSIAISANLENNPCLSATAHTSSLARGNKGGLPVSEAQTVFVPTIVKQPLVNLQSKVDKLDSSDLFAEKENYPCTALSANP